MLSRLATGYPRCVAAKCIAFVCSSYFRFFINKLIAAFATDIVNKYGSKDEQAMLFPTLTTANRCIDFMISKDEVVDAPLPRILQLSLDRSTESSPILTRLSPRIVAVIYSKEKWPLAKQYWQHSGDGISSRRAEFCHGLFLEGLLIEDLSTKSGGQARLHKGPRRYQKESSIDLSSSSYTNGHFVKGGPELALKPSVNAEGRESSVFVEERFGRNLEVSLVNNARTAIKRRIAGSLAGEVDLTAAPTAMMDASVRGVASLGEDDVYLYPCGMNAIFNAHQIMLEARGPLKSIVFGFPYVDTLKILEKFGPGCIFYGHGSSEDLDDLERRLESGERYLALFCEFPGNPLLTSPDLARIRALSRKYDFGVVVDETIGNFINIHVLPYADILVSSLTKIFTGECNVSGGSSILNPEGQYYQQLKDVLARQYEDNYWAEDVIFMERNSRDFISRIERINENAEAICELLLAHPTVKRVYYPKFVESRRNYDFCRAPCGGYGGLFSVTFNEHCQAVAFFDRIDTAKGPSLGTNFTLTSPYAILAHYQELEWAAQFGVEADLVRVSVGLEDKEMLKSIFDVALQAAELAQT